ncbi:hypothetical protein CK203_109607 [Vitis vinifera]|uniref:Uncharacterized protein n=1 Tax=Vitis vinifera TaxID=29760 RepID=A0A438CFQ9_VITVI|nr:hypothetical protein CK203_109607 [Vitis vinifera]
MSTCQVIILDSRSSKEWSKACRFIVHLRVAVVTHMVNTSRSMKCFLKGTSSSPLVQFSSLSEDTNDLGDGGGTPTFLFNLANLFFRFIDLMRTVIVTESDEIKVGTSNHDVLACQYILPNSCKKLAEELVQMFILEAAVACSGVTLHPPQDDRYCWTDELYPGELDDLGRIQKKLVGFESHSPVIRSNHEILQISPMRIDTCPTLLHYHYTNMFELKTQNLKLRVDEIFAVIGEENPEPAYMAKRRREVLLQ